VIIKNRGGEISWVVNATESAKIADAGSRYRVMMLMRRDN
jgi:hypothetical protein